MKVVTVIFFLLGIHRHKALDIHAGKVFVMKGEATTKVNNYRRALSEESNYDMLPAGSASECPEDASLSKEICLAAAQIAVANSNHSSAEVYHKLTTETQSYYPCGCYIIVSGRGRVYVYFNELTHGCNAVSYASPICMVPSTNVAPTDQGIININHHNVDNVTCVGEINKDTFVPSVTCSASKVMGTKTVMEMKQGNCTGTELNKIVNKNDNIITMKSGPVDEYIDDVDQSFVFCLVVQTFFRNETEVITEGKTEGKVIFERDLTGEFTLNVTMESYTTVSTSLDKVVGDTINLNAYQCENDYSTISNPSDKPQGSTLSVCIATTQSTSSVSLTGVSMTISPFTTGLFEETNIITSDSAVNSVLTKLFRDGSKVRVKTVLVSKYFADTSNKIVVSGTANYIYSSDRMLRILQGIGDENISSFDLTIDLKANEAGIFQLSSSTAYNLFHVYGMSALMTCVVTFFI